VVLMIWVFLCLTAAKDEIHPDMTWLVAVLVANWRQIFPWLDACFVVLRWPIWTITGTMSIAPKRWVSWSARPSWSESRKHGNITMENHHF
jgi:hypothetical protein